MSANQMMVRADHPRPARMLARIAVALSVSAFGLPRGAANSSHYGRSAAPNDMAVNAGSVKNDPRKEVGAFIARLLSSG